MFDVWPTFVNRLIVYGFFLQTQATTLAGAMQSSKRYTPQLA